MKILILNWRDIKNPTSGGAEILTHEIAKRWVSWGHEVTQFSSVYPGCKSSETIDGVKIIRKGHPYTRYIFSSVHFSAFVYYLRNFRGKFDVVIDEVHGIPFFTPWYVKEKKIVLICEVADSLWKRIFGNIIGTIGLLVENFYLRFVYKNIPYLTISESTKADLIKHSVREKQITVLPMGITTPKQLTLAKKTTEPTLIFVGRLSRSKGVEETIHMLAYVVKKYPKIKLWIVGRGTLLYKERLEAMVKRLSLQNHVEFLGFVTEAEKFTLMGKAHLLITPSFREGFGLTVPEAGIVGTPVIGYNSMGLKDIIKDNENGVLLKENSPRAMARAVEALLVDKKRYQRLSKQAIVLAKQYNWDETAKEALAVMRKSS